MADLAKPNLDVSLRPRTPPDRFIRTIHPAWLRLIGYCADLGHGEIEKLKIQDGIPMTAEITTKKVKFNP